MLELLKKQEQRFIYLETLYKMVDGSPMSSVNHHQIAVQAELTPQSARDAFYYLLNERLLEAQNYDGAVRITHQGVKEYEAAIISKEQRSCSATRYIANNIVQFSGKISKPHIHFSEQEDSPETHTKAKKPKKYLIPAAMQNLKGTLKSSLFDAGVRFLLSRLRRLT